MNHPDSRWCALIRPRSRLESQAQAASPPAASLAGSARPIVDRTDFDPRYDPRRPIECECCGTTMFYTAACKIQCPNCGYKRDCSDP